MAIDEKTVATQRMRLLDCVLTESVSSPRQDGRSDTGNGVVGQSQTFNGVRGISGTGTGVIGVSTAAPGVAGQSETGTGVTASTISGYALESTNGRVRFAGISGIATIKAGDTQVVVNPGGGQQ